MATVFNPNKQDEIQKKQGTMLAQGASGTPTNNVGGGNVPQQQASAQKASTSGRFTNIQNYLNANQGSGLAGQVTGKIQGVADQANTQLNQASNAFQQASEQGKAKEFTQGTYDQLGSATKLDDPIGETFKQAGEQLNTQYKGPMELGNQQNILANQQQLGALTQNTGSAEGRAQLLQRFFNKPTYAQGQSRLDTLILGGKENRPELAKTKAISGEFGRDVNDAARQSAQTVEARQKDAEATRTQSKNALEAAKSQQQKDLERQINEFNTSEEERAKQRFDLAQNQSLKGIGEGTRTMASALGLDDQTLLRAGATYNKGQADLSNISPEQAAVMNKIASLTGGQELALNDKVQAGQYGFDEAALSSGLSPIYANLNNTGRGGYGRITSTLGDTSQLNALGYSPGQLSEFLNGAGGNSGITEVWGGYGRDANDAISDLVNWNNARRGEAKQQAINNMLNNLYKQSGYQG